MLRLAPALTLFLMLGPVGAGLVGVFMPAFGILPALNGDTFSFDWFGRVLATPGIGQSIWLSFSVGLGATAASVLIVIVVLASLSGTRLLDTLVRWAAPLVAVPHAAAAFGLAFLIMPSGWLVRVVSPDLTGWTRPPDLLIVNDPAGLAMVFGLVIKEVPFLLIVSVAALNQIDADRLVRTARTFGYGRFWGWIVAVLPQLNAQLLLPILAVLAFATSVVDVALILGPSTPVPLSVQILRWASDADLQTRFLAGAGGVLQLGVTLTALLAWMAVTRVIARICAAQLQTGWRGRHDLGARIAGTVAGVFSVSLALAGVTGLAVSSLTFRWPFPSALPTELTLANWTRAAALGTEPIGNTVLIGLGATLLALVLTLACLENEYRSGKRPGEGALFLLYVPLIVPQISFLFGLLLGALRVRLDGTLFAVTAAHLVFVLPYVFLALGEPYRQLDRRYLDIARALGRSPARVFFTVRLPMMLRPILVAAALGFSVSVALYLPTVLIGGGRVPTIATEAVALAAGGDRRLIGAYALLQTLLPALGFALAVFLPRVLTRRPGAREVRV